MSSLIKNIQCKFEKNFVKLMGWKHIPGSESELVYLEIKKYCGDSVELEDIIISPGDIVAEVHIDNLNIAKIDNSLRSISYNYQEEFSNLIKACDLIEEYKDLKAIYGITVLHTLLRRMGFACFPIKNPLYRAYLKFWENMLKESFSNEVKRKKRKKYYPMECWISIDKLRKQVITSKGGKK